MATIKDIAKETGLGLATISKYLNGGHVLDRNKAAIEAAIEKSGYTVNEFARGLKAGRSRIIGVVIPELSNIFITSIITVVEDILRQNGYGTIVCDCRTDIEREREAVRFLMGKRVDGIINMPVSKDGAHLLPVIEKNLPVVLIDRMIPELKGRVNAVLVDNVDASASAVKTLFDAGHLDIGVILGPQEVFTSQQRLLGYTQVFIQNSLTPDLSRVLYSDYSVQGGYESMKQLLAGTMPEAVFVTNYEMTLGAIIAINESGVRIPEQLSFIGFDNMQLSKAITPKLTIITQPLEEIGESAADILITRLEDGGDALPSKVVTLSTGISPGATVLSKQ